MDAQLEVGASAAFFRADQVMLICELAHQPLTRLISQAWEVFPRGDSKATGMLETSLQSGNARNAPGRLVYLQAEAYLFRYAMVDTSDTYGGVEISLGIEDIHFGGGVYLREVAVFASIKLRLEATLTDRLKHLKSKAFLDAIKGNPRFEGAWAQGESSHSCRRGDWKGTILRGGLSLLMDLGSPSVISGRRPRRPLNMRALQIYNGGNVGKCFRVE